MKKFLAILLTLVSLLTVSVASAENVPAINWEDIDIEALGIEGSWYTFDTIALQIWIPDVFLNEDVTEEDGEGVIGKFVTADQTAAIYGQVIEGYEGATMEELIASIESNGATEIERCLLNGLDAVSYSIPDTDAVYVTFVTESGNFVQFIFTPVSDEGFAEVAQLVTASIMPEQ
ncbi:MAG: hypothetical protein E7317_09175 [Clostridiales bacterium]|nr:hypothetical protein [Clostridiales bacterium]